MKKRCLAGLAVAVLLALGAGSPAHASLVVSGTVLYAGAQRNLIYDNDLNITWLDYSKSAASWNTQQSWAADLSLTVNGVTYDNWRLPATVDGPRVQGTNGTTTAGYNITTSEMGHLYYVELGNKGQYALNGSFQADFGLTNEAPFANLELSWYFSGTEYALDQLNTWGFYMRDGNQDEGKKSSGLYALAVLPGQIQAASVPEPASMLLIGFGLVGLLGLKRRQR